MVNRPIATRLTTIGNPQSHRMSAHMHGVSKGRHKETTGSPLGVSALRSHLFIASAQSEKPRNVPHPRSPRGQAKYGRPLFGPDLVQVRCSAGRPQRQAGMVGGGVDTVVNTSEKKKDKGCIFIDLVI